MAGETRHVRLRMMKVKAASKRDYGERVYKVFDEFEPALIAQNWQPIKRAREYCYLRPPEGVGPPFVVEADVPSREWIVELANRWHQEGQERIERFGVWSAWYVPEHTSRMRCVDGPEGHPDIGKVYESTVEATFTFGIRLLWTADVSWSDGVAQYHESNHNIIPDAEPVADLLSVATVDEPDRDAETFAEGALRRVQGNRYERNRQARQKCIEYHGGVCAVCGLDFGRMYGPAAQGFIHVHHHKPVSVAGGEYQIDPVNDLSPVCPNCHSVVHLREPPYTLDEVWQMLNKAAGNI
jgi:5-methylcytosine-specific restriction protein A